jgi:hypothetical protein
MKSDGVFEFIVMAVTATAGAMLLIYSVRLLNL